MKTLILFAILLCFSGCLVPENDIMRIDPSQLKFKAGQNVKTTEGFYSACAGTIVGFSLYVDPKTGPSYSVALNCPNIGLLKESVIIRESKLTAGDQK